MAFARKVWKFLVAVKDGLALLFLLLFFMMLFALLSARPNPGVVRDGALLLDLDGVVVEEVAPIDPFAALLSNTVPTREYAARELVAAIDAAASDERIEALALDLTGFLGGGAVNLQEVSEALDRFRASDKPIYSYAVAYSDSSVLLAAHSDEIWVDPLGGVAITGPGGENLYYANALERFNVTANVYRVGTYKSAVEPWTETGMSPEARENMAQLLATIWEEWRANVQQARPDADIDLVTSDVAGWLAASNNDIAEASLAAGLADRIGTRVEWGERIAQVVGEDRWNDDPGSFAATEYDPWLADVNGGIDLGNDNKIGVVTIAGVISDGEAGPGSAGAERIANLLDNALDEGFDALVVRVNSPGGTVTGSETIRRAILRHKDAGIPIAVSMGNYAASGGYWVATPADRIFAEPQTLTGSIGVFVVVPSFEGVLSDYGVSTDGVRTTGLSGQPDLFDGFSPEVDSVLQAGVESSYSRFLGLVAEARGISLERADELGQGRVWDGGAARQLGLVDQFGDLQAAIAWAAERAELAEGDYDVTYLGANAPSYDSIFAQLRAGGNAKEQTGRDVTSMFTRREMARLGRITEDLDQLMGAQGIQARCLECTILPSATPAAGPPRAADNWLFALAQLWRD
ncbi:signal peptide peptidase SppA [Aurantiacibacter sp. D1-12]|uniref:signal peptide peptidase SppA n=1 Tax=Aurantiacibacter sp. D1-12 TaxID=2993658 RepID=UPI00237D226A|nr:signal peptide peptidase SppA [Aurantiacibacter sp. D1-12]MDE1467096.1 signal peptide peptidase SppA [Aurantiacibacter sp. D1-12]